MTQTVDRPATEPSGRPGTRSFAKLRPLSMVILTVVLCAISVSHAPSPMLWLSNLLNYAAVIGIIACGMTFVMICGGFDLSVGSMAAVCGVVMVMMIEQLGGGSWGVIAIGAAVTMAAGLALGAANGALIAYVGVNPFVTTLSTMLIFRGIGLVITGGGKSQVVPLHHADAYRLVYWGGVDMLGITVSVPVMVFVAVFVASVYLLSFTRFGHYVYATGGNQRASWLAGINTKKITTLTYVVSGLACAIAAVLWSALSNSAQASDYEGREMVVIASVIVGGTPLGGGRGGLFSTLSGLFLLCTIDQMLTQFGVGPEYCKIVQGLIILAAVAIHSYLKRTSGR